MNLKFCLLLAILNFVSCNAISQDPYIAIEKDFPKTNKLDFCHVKTYEDINSGSVTVDGSLIWNYATSSNTTYGDCYDLESGERISVMLNKGKAMYEFTMLPSFKVGRDSLYFIGDREIKTFAKNDIITNKPMDKRAYTVSVVPDSIRVSQMIKLNNGSILSTTRPKELFNTPTNEKVSSINKNDIVIFNKQKAHGYKTVNYDEVDFASRSWFEDDLFSNEGILKNAYGGGLLASSCTTDTALVVVSEQLIFYTLNTKNGKVLNNKSYTKLIIDGTMSLNEHRMSVRNLRTSDKYIAIYAVSYVPEERHTILIYDWNLNPIKRYDLPILERGNGYTISVDCKSVYRYEKNTDGLALYKADLSL